MNPMHPLYPADTGSALGDKVATELLKPARTEQWLKLDTPGYLRNSVTGAVIRSDLPTPDSRPVPTSQATRDGERWRADPPNERGRYVIGVVYANGEERLRADQWVGFFGGNRWAIGCGLKDRAYRHVFSAQQQARIRWLRPATAEQIGDFPAESES